MEHTERLYRLHVKFWGAWKLVREIRAHSHAEALQLAMLSLGPEYHDKPIRLEQEEEAPGEV